MRAAALIPLIGFICNLLLAIFVFSRSPRSTANRVYLALGLCIAGWNLGQFALFITEEGNHAQALFWLRFEWVPIIFIPLLLFHLSMLLTKTKVGRFMPIAYGVLTLMAATVPTTYFMTNMPRHLGSAGWYAQPGPMLKISTLPFVLMFVAIYILTKKRKTLPPMYRSRLTALTIAQAALSILGTNDTLPLNGFDNYPGTEIPVYPYGSIAAVFYGVIVAYSVLQHHLLDVQIGLSRIMAQVVRFTFLTITTLALLLVASLLLPKFDFPSVGASLTVFMISAIIATVVFPRLFSGTGVEKWEHRILGDHFEYQDRVRAFIEGMPFHRDMPNLLDGLHEILAGAFRFHRYWIVLRDNTQRAFVLMRSLPDEPHSQVAELEIPSPIFTFFERKGTQYLSLGRHSDVPSARSIEGKARAQLARFDAEFAFPVMLEGDLLGLVLVGEKPHGEPLTTTDLGLLIDLTKQLSLVVNQIRLKDEILRAQELELLGRMSRGMAHDLNNLLTPLWTMLQLAQEGFGPDGVDEELLEVSQRNLKTVRAYIKEALFFSENLRPDIQLGRIDMLVQQTVEVARANRRKPVEIIADTPGEVLVEMDEVLLQRLLTNLISNAIDASTPGEEVRVELERLAKTEATRDWLRLRVVDRGEGIPKENIQRVTTPYFTTKNRGDETRGFGLGLAISRKIAALHSGTLTISSQVGRGTTVQIDLPIRQARSVEAPAAA
jgi:signal transduction histidine kinase